MRKLNRRAQINPTLKIILIAISFLFGCGSSDNNSSLKNNSIRSIKGKLSSDFIKTKKRTARGISDIGDISEILAFAIKNGKADLDLTKTVPVSDDGNFLVNFDITKKNDTDWLMIMSNPNATTKEEYLGNFISMSQGKNTLALMPIEQATANIDLGNLSKNGEETTSSNSISNLAENFTIDLNNLLTRAGLDSSVKGAKNDYINYDSISDTKYASTLTFRYQNIDYIHNTFSDVSTYKKYFEGWSISIATNKFLQAEMPKLCAGDYNIKLIPPSEVIDTDNRVFSPLNPFVDTNLTTLENGNTCANYDVSGFTFRSGDNALYKGVQIGAQTFLGKPENGYWKLTSNNNTLAIFDFNVGSIFDTDGDYQILLPSVKFTIDNDYKITQIDFKWYMYNKDDKKFQEITDETIIKKFVSRCSVNITDYDGVSGNTDRIDDNVLIIDWGYDKVYNTTITKFNKDWYVTGNPDNSKITIRTAMISMKLSEYLTVYFDLKF